MKEFITCPECNTIQLATINTETVPFHTYIHYCEKCDYVITESDWNPLKAISVRQPWTWLIVNGYKPLENRNTLKNFRGPVLIHASMQFDKKAFDEFMFRAGISKITPEIRFMPIYKRQFDMGGIVGAVTITDSITKSDSKWFIGPNAFVLTDPMKLPFTPCKGKLGFFNPEID